MGAATPAAREDADTAGALPVGTWVLSKGRERVTLPLDSRGFVQVEGLYENTHAELWKLLVSPGCSALVAFSADSTELGATIIEHTYHLCGADRAAAALRALP